MVTVDATCIDTAALAQRYNTGDTVALVILTHPAQEKAVKAALAGSGALPVNQSPVKVLRIEDI